MTSLGVGSQDFSSSLHVRSFGSPEFLLPKTNDKSPSIFLKLQHEVLSREMRGSGRTVVAFLTESKQP